MKRLYISSLIVIGAVTTLFSSRAPAAQPSDAAPSAPSKEFACSKDKSCATFKWMKANMAPAAANGDAPALAIALKYVSEHAPSEPGIEKWKTIASEGEAAAKKG